MGSTQEMTSLSKRRPFRKWVFSRIIRDANIWKNNSSEFGSPYSFRVLASLLLTSLIALCIHLNSPTKCYDSHLAFKTNDSSLQLAYEHSYGFFHNIPNAEWEQHFVQRVSQSEHYRYPQDHDRYASNQSASWIFSNWDPFFTCPHVQKIGGLGGGSKWICDVDRLQKVIERRKIYDKFWSPPKSFFNTSRVKVQTDHMQLHQPHCLIYSIGSNGNYVWEDSLFDVLGLDCEFHIFDPEPFDRPGMTLNKNMHFHQWGLGSSYSLDWMYRQSRPRVYKKAGQNRSKTHQRSMYSFQEMRKRLGHENCTIDLFKVDCEGCEWHTYKDWIDADLRQILIETHELPTKQFEKRTVFGILPAIAASEVFDTFYKHGFALFSKEVNTMKGNGFSAEWSWLKLRSNFFTA